MTWSRTPAGQPPRVFFRSDRGGGLDLPYLQFIGSGLVAFAGVQIAMVEASYPVMGGFKWRRTYYGMAAAPLRIGDIVAGRSETVVYTVP